MNRQQRKARDLGFNYGRQDLTILVGRNTLTPERAQALKDRYNQGWATHSPIAAAHRRRELRVARIVFLAQLALALLGLSVLLRLAGAVVAAFTPGGGHGF